MPCKIAAVTQRDGVELTCSSVLDGYYCARRADAMMPVVLFHSTHVVLPTYTVIRVRTLVDVQAPGQTEGLFVQTLPCFRQEHSPL
jgi:hypothetical protein